MWWKREMGVYINRIRKFPSLACRTFWQVGREDPRRVAHSFKVGLLLSLVSLLYLVGPLYDDMGQNAMLAVMTVVVVLEFTAGATLCKGLNRGLGTLLAGVLAFLISLAGNKSSHVFEVIIVATTVFLIGVAATYMRFIPYIKKNCDHGVLMFLLTFNFILVSSYRISNVLEMAQERFYAVAIGCGASLLMSLLVFPHWSGEDLHDSTVLKLEDLAKSIEACVDRYFEDNSTEGSEDKVSDDDPIYQAVLDSKTDDDTLALYASWEPRYCCRFSWKQYVKVGTVLRQIGYTVVALHGCLHTEIQVISCRPFDLENMEECNPSFQQEKYDTPKAVRVVFKDPCIRLAAEVSKVLTELADSIRSRRHCSPSILSDHLHETLEDLDTALKSQPRLFLNRSVNSDQHSVPSTDVQALAAVAAAADAGVPNSPVNVTPQGSDSPKQAAIPSSKTDNSTQPEWRSKNEKTNSVAEALPPVTAKEAGEKRTLRPGLSKITITSLEFAEALPFAAFASLLVEIVARLDNVIEEVEELGRIAHFKEFRPLDEVIVNCDNELVGNGLHSHLYPQRRE